MALPLVVIVGRPNVGKSSLFNALVKSRVAIVDPTAGVTRDGVSMVLRSEQRSCLLVDTGGIGAVDDMGLEEEIKAQIEVSMSEAHVILFVVDSRDGPVPMDFEIARRLRRLGKPILLVVNKCDSLLAEADARAFHELSVGDPLAVSTVHGRNIADLREAIEGRLPERDQEDPAEEPRTALRVAVVGRTNSGKSSLVNHLVGAARMIVSDLPGTTRDSVDLPFEWQGRRFIAVDTAGMRKSKSVSGTADFYGQARTQRAIRRSDVALLMIDATQPISRVERIIAQCIIDHHRPVLLVISKWDVVGDRTLDDYGEYVRTELPFLDFAPITCVSAKEGFHVGETLELVRELDEQAGRRMTTAQINHALKRAMERKGPPTRGGRTGKIYFGTQIGVRPPTVVLFVNESRILSDSYLRYLSGALREEGEFAEIPLRFVLRDRQRSRDFHKE